MKLSLPQFLHGFIVFSLLLVLVACGGDSSDDSSDSSELPADVTLYSSPETADAEGALVAALGANYLTPYASSSVSTSRIVKGEPKFGLLDCICSAFDILQCGKIKARDCMDPDSGSHTLGNKGSSSGEPHLRSFDGLKYDSHAHGVFWLLKDSLGEFSVQAIQSFFDTDLSGAYNSAIAVEAHGHTIVFYTDPTDRVTFDGETLVLANTETLVWPGAVLMHADNEQFVLMAEDDKTLLVQLEAYLSPEIAIPSGSDGRYDGLLGDANGSALDDVSTTSSVDEQGQLGALLLNNFLNDDSVAYRLTLADFYDNFIEPWIVAEEDSLFDEGDYVAYLPPATALTLNDFATAAEQASTEASCLSESGLSESNDVFNCVFDVLVADTDLADAASLIGRLEHDPAPSVWIEVSE